jgi:membrane-bound ClpP family serine protease
MATLAVVLILSGLLLAVLEVHAPSGVLGSLGLLAAISGVGLLAFSGASSGWLWPGLTVLLLLAAGFAVIVVKVTNAQRSPHSVGEIIGHRGLVREPLNPQGWILLDGAHWRARSSDDSPLPIGTKVEVVNSKGPLLTVRRYSPSPDQAGL